MSTKTLSRIIATAALAVAVSPAATPTVTIFDQFEMQRKVNSATRYFEQVWSQIFANRGARYSTPKIVSYTGSVSTACGVLGSNNAFYCGADERIYYDAVFFTGMMKAAGNYLSIDGDYAASLFWLMSGAMPFRRSSMPPALSDCFARIWRTAWPAPSRSRRPSTATWTEATWKKRGTRLSWAATLRARPGSSTKTRMAARPPASESSIKATREACGRARCSSQAGSEARVNRQRRLSAPSMRFCGEFISQEDKERNHV